MIHELALRLFFDKPLIMCIGIFTVIFIILTATIGFINYKGIKVIPIKWHPILAIITITIVFTHSFLGLSIFINN